MLHGPGRHAFMDGRLPIYDALILKGRQEDGFTEPPTLALAGPRRLGVRRVWREFRPGPMGGKRAGHEAIQEFRVMFMLLSFRLCYLGAKRRGDSDVAAT
ncbi:MAG: hypothetical protein C7B45_10200 [Sulfobacillus acidophilus]|uniref:Uncharacterized protein n=1 Tax=Sulfobacillus acidophilus TaxID=53633 RepID=A0A2T2WH61_9FIRM|nr:MAG: hypothetical protein C7B45_10200 [Sulfobacillus acidophilus]